MFSFFKNKKFVIIILNIIILLILVLTIDTYITPVKNILPSGWTTEISSKKAYIDELSKIKNENDFLKGKLEQLENESWKLEFTKRENIELTKILAFKEQLKEYKFLGANIIDIDDKNGFSVSIDRGRKDNVNVNDTVISGGGLVGRVSSVGINSSEVICIIDPACTIAASTKSPVYTAIVKGSLDLEKKDICELVSLSPEINMNYGDKIITSGTGGIFPKDIPIGEVIEVRKNDTDINYRATVKPSVDFRKLEIVAVLKKH